MLQPSGGQKISVCSKMDPSGGHHHWIHTCMGCQKSKKRKRLWRNRTRRVHLRKSMYQQWLMMCLDSYSACLGPLCFCSSNALSHQLSCLSQYYVRVYLSVSSSQCFWSYLLLVMFLIWLTLSSLNFSFQSLLTLNLKGIRKLRVFPHFLLLSVAEDM